MSARPDVGGWGDPGRRSISVCVASRLAGQPTPAGGMVQPRQQRSHQAQQPHAHGPVAVASRPADTRTIIMQPLPRRTAREQRELCARLSTPRTARQEAARHQERHNTSSRDAKPPAPEAQPSPPREVTPPPAAKDQEPDDADCAAKPARLMCRLNESASWLSDDGASASDVGSDAEGGTHEAKPAPPGGKAPMCLYEMFNESATWIPCDVSQSDEDEPPRDLQPPDNPYRPAVDTVDRGVPLRSFSF